MRRQSRNSSRNVAVCGILAALAVTILLAGGLIPIGTFAAPIFAGICLLPIAMDIGVKWALLCYVAVSLLGLLLVPDLELILFFIALLGYYPMLQPKLLAIKNKVLRYGVKLLLFNAAVVGVYAFMLFVFTNPALAAELAESPLWFWAGLLLLGNITFVLYDIMLDKVRLLYVWRVRKYLFK